MGGGLYLLIKPDGVKLWRLDYKRSFVNKRNTLAFGVYPEVSLADVRIKGDTARKQIAAELDPSEER